MLVCQLASNQRTGEPDTARCCGCGGNRCGGDAAGRHGYASRGEAGNRCGKTGAEHAALPNVGVADNGFTR